MRLRSSAAPSSICRDSGWRQLKASAQTGALTAVCGWGHPCAAAVLAIGASRQAQLPSKRPVPVPRVLLRSAAALACMPASPCSHARLRATGGGGGGSRLECRRAGAPPVPTRACGCIPNVGRRVPAAGVGTPAGTWCRARGLLPRRSGPSCRLCPPPAATHHRAVAIRRGGHGRRAQETVMQPAPKSTAQGAALAGLQACPDCQQVAETCSGLPGGE